MTETPTATTPRTASSTLGGCPRLGLKSMPAARPGVLPMGGRPGASPGSHVAARGLAGTNA
jgi:hypothetical protein